jgi:plasmid stabilization system protein ParE
MIYTLLWKPAAEDRLTEIWTEAANRSAIADAANAIDRVLRERPLDVGESRDAVTRILIEEPLVIVYEVSEADRLVQVLAVRAVPKRG